MNKVEQRVLRHVAFEKFFQAFVFGCAVFAICTVGFVIIYALIQGGSRISFSFLTLPSRSGGLEGGILYQMLGTCMLMVTSAAVVTPFALGIAITVKTTHKTRLRKIIRSVLHVFNATPSILFGILGFIFFVKFLDWDKSWLGGGVILALMILPTVTLSVVDRIATIPRTYIDTALSLGLKQDQIILKILIPYGYGGLLTGLVMGLARAAGETAPIMFTAAVFAGATIPDGIKDNPLLALPYHIFNLAQDVLQDAGLVTAWATAFVLISFVFIMSLMAAPFRSRSHEEARVL